MTPRITTLLLPLCALLYAGCASQPAQQGGGPPPTAEAPADHPATAVALSHYAAIEAGDEAAFEATCFQSSSTQFWWTAGRKMVEKHGVHWEYTRTDPQPDGRVKVWFIRIQADGTQRGLELPCTVRPDDAGNWLVYASSQ